MQTFYDDMPFLFLMLQIWGLVATFALTFLCRRKKRAIMIGPVLMLAVNFVAQNIIAGEGPGACVGAFVLPACGLFVSWATLSVAEHFERDKKG